MRPLLLASVLLLLSACGTATSVPDAALEPSLSPVGPMPTAPVPPGPVSTRGLVTVIDKDGPVLCLGGVADSLPPQCSGVPLAGWDWDAFGGMFEKRRGVRFGDFFVSGTYDGTTLTVADAIASPLYDGIAQPSTESPVRGDGEHTQAELAEIAEALEALPGWAGGGFGNAAERVHVSVVYDDGVLQDWTDSTYGEDTVEVASLLVDVED